MENKRDIYASLFIEMAKNKPSPDEICNFILDRFQNGDRETIIIAAVDYSLIAQDYDVYDLLVNKFMIPDRIFNLRANSEKHIGNREKVKDFFRQIKLRTILNG